MSLRNYILKQQWDTTTHLLKMTKIQTQAEPNADKNMEQQELSFIAGRNVKWYNHLGREFGSFLLN